MTKSVVGLRGAVYKAFDSVEDARLTWQSLTNKRGAIVRLTDENGTVFTNTILCNADS